MREKSASCDISQAAKSLAHSPTKTSSCTFLFHTCPSPSLTLLRRHTKPKITNSSLLFLQYPISTSHRDMTSIQVFKNKDGVVYTTSNSTPASEPYIGLVF